MGLFSKKSKEEKQHEAVQNIKSMLRSMAALKALGWASQYRDEIYKANYQYDEYQRKVAKVDAWQEKMQKLCEAAVDALETDEEIMKVWNDKDNFFAKILKQNPIKY